MSAFGQWLKGVRERKGLTQPVLAKLVGVSQPTVAGWEAGSIPGGDRIKPLAAALDVGLDEIVDRLASSIPGQPAAQSEAYAATFSISQLGAELRELRAAVEALQSKMGPAAAPEEVG